MTSPQAAHGATSSGGQGSAVVQIKLMDQLPQMAGAPQMGPGPALPPQSTPQLADGYPWGWTDAQDMQMSWLPPPAEEMEHVWPAWPYDGSNDLMPGFMPTAGFLETPQKMPPRFDDEWTPPKPDFALDLMAQEHMPEFWQYQQVMDCGGPHDFAMVSASSGVPSVPPLPVGSGTSTPPLTPRQKKFQNPMASPVTLKTPNTRIKNRVPMSAGGQTSLPATPQAGRWVPETPSPQRTYLQQPSQRMPFAEMPMPASVFP